MDTDIVKKEVKVENLEEPAKPPKRKYKKKVKIKKPQPKRKPTPFIKVPLNYYKKLLEEVETLKPLEYVQKKHFDSNVPPRIQQHCHHPERQTFSGSIGKNGLHQAANFQLAAKQALEMRDFKALYKVVIKGYELNDKALNKILYDYLYIAIRNDPMIEEKNRESLLLEAVRGCQDLNDNQKIIEITNDKDALKFIKESHLLIKRTMRGIMDKDEDDEEL